MRRESLWVDIAFGNTAFSAMGGTILFTLNAAALALRPFTFVRWRAVLQVRSDQTASSEDQLGAYGIAVVSDEAVAVGVTAVPTPVTEMNSDLWFVHQIFMHSIQVSSAVGILSPAGSVYQVDSKAMRKVEDGQDVVGVGELSGAGAGFVLQDAGRALIKLH